MKRAIVAAMAALACAGAWAGDSSITYSDIVASNVSDGSANEFTFIGGSITATMGAVGATSTTTTYDFLTWPTNYSASLSNNGASAGVSFANGVFSGFASSGDNAGAGSSVDAALVLNFSIVPGVSDLSFTAMVERTLSAQVENLPVDDWGTPRASQQGGAGGTNGGSIWNPVPSYLFGNGISVGPCCAGATWTDLSTDSMYSYLGEQQIFVDAHRSGSIVSVGFFLRAGSNAAVAPIPEPSTYAMLAAGLGAVGWIARRRTAAR